MKLVIVESPNKCATIQGYLGKGYKVVASKGHIRELATSGKGGYGVDLENNFEPNYIIPKNKRPVVEDLKAEAAKAEEVIIATDPDREGEAIAWHLAKVLGLDLNKTKRLEFHEITKDAIDEALKNPRTIHMNSVNSQQVRRISDRILGFRLSSLMTKKIGSPSAGRVQSALLELINDHQNEINTFIPEKYYDLSIDIKIGRNELHVPFYKYNDVKKISDENIDKEIVSRLGSNCKLVSVKKVSKIVESKPAFSTSALQQEASSTLGFDVSRTSKVSQELFEGIQVNGKHIGLITYIRTDGTDLSETYVNNTFNFIEKFYGKEYLGKYKKGKKILGAQEAHEAIRPTDNFNFPTKIKEYLTSDQYRLYKLIYEHTIASLMAPEKEEVTTYVFDANGVEFKLEKSKTIFDGFKRASLSKDKEEKELPSMNENDEFSIAKVNNEEKFTEPPALYSEAKLVKLMEEKGIGRPSTYAATIQTLKARKYTEKIKGLTGITESGVLTAIVLKKYFPDIVSTKFTADLENDLDKIRDGEIDPNKVLKEFYDWFTERVDEGERKIWKEVNYVEGRTCPKCGAPLLYKKSKYGEFIGCSNFPQCDYRETQASAIEYTGEKCPDCGAPLVYRYKKTGKRITRFIGCSNYPKCHFIKSEEKQENIVHGKCPDCGGDLVEKHHGNKTFLGCSNFPNCKHIERLEKK